MHKSLKSAMRAANYPVSEGDELVQEDLQSARDFLYFSGVNIGENFDKYEELFPLDDGGEGEEGDNGEGDSEPPEGGEGTGGEEPVEGGETIQEPVEGDNGEGGSEPPEGVEEVW